MYQYIEFIDTHSAKINLAIKQLLKANDYFLSHFSEQ